MLSKASLGKKRKREDVVDIKELRKQFKEDPFEFLLATKRMKQQLDGAMQHISNVSQENQQLNEIAETNNLQLLH
jgi:predicted hydrolase (HD superfamily)